MDENDLRSMVADALEGAKLSPGQFEELIATLVSSLPKTDAPKGVLEPNNVVLDLQKQISEETDWRKRAALAAKIVSLHLE